MTEERHKRALPVRHSFLTDAVSTVLDSQSVQVPQIDGRTILKLDQDISSCDIHPEPSNTSSTFDLPQPIFRILPQRRSIKKKNSVAISDDYYLARHRKHEMEEKKQKNREKERLEHEFYQQKQLVERLTTLDKSTLLSIVSSITKDHHSTMPPADLDRLHQTLLQDAREQLYRYEKLGLGRKRGQGFTVSAQMITTDRSHSPPLSNSKYSTIKIPASLSSSSHTTTRKPISIKTETSATMDNNSNHHNNRKLTKEASVLAHFQSHGHRSAGAGKRKSLRTAIAFGEKIPTMNDTEFELPLDLFGDMMDKRRLAASLP
ncbi:hypothetical protein BC941DRAFT_425725 [Chlamydoabsidia padenii]|nr:hypothetical protein BC941DRAFT_425725 [Chlamydoabsidia padenii]